MSLQITELRDITSPEDFRRTLNDPEVSQFLADFQRWNTVALPIMDRMSRPYQSFQNDLIALMKGKTGSSILDFGSGLGSIVVGLLERGDNPEQVFALDPDFPTLRRVPEILSQAGFKGSVKLIHSSSMCSLPLEPGSLDSIVSGLGGVTYSGFFFTNGHVLHGRDALVACLRECHRVLKSEGYLGFSSLVPNPDFRKIKKQSLWSLISGLHFISLFTGIANTPRIERASHFMRVCAEEGKVHYLTADEWQSVLAECGFSVQEVKQGGYAGQGLAILAQKAF